MAGLVTSNRIVKINLLMMTNGVFEILGPLVARALLIINIDIDDTYLHKLNAVGDCLPY